MARQMSSILHAEVDVNAVARKPKSFTVFWCRLFGNHSHFIKYNPFRVFCPNCGWESKGWD